MSGYSPILPLQTDPDDGIALNKTYKEVAKQNFKMLLLTIPGEKVMDPEFGIGLKTFLFESYTSNTKSSLISTIKKQVSMYLPYIHIDDIKIGDSNIDSNIMSISVSYFIKPLDLADIVEIFLVIGA